MHTPRYLAGAFRAKGSWCIAQLSLLADYSRERRDDRRDFVKNIQMTVTWNDTFHGVDCADSEVFRLGGESSTSLAQGT